MKELEISQFIQAMTWGAVDVYNLLKKSIKGNTDFTNASGDTISTMDLLANEIFINNLSAQNWCLGVASEELEDPRFFDNFGEYVVTIDPLDGSSNIDVDGQVGTIFSLYKVSSGAKFSEDFFREPGKNLVAAGYILYGANLTMVVAHNNSVKEYRIDPSNYSELHLDVKSNKTLTCPEEGKVVAINSGNYPRWDQQTKNWFDTVVEYGKSSFRYSGCMVADFHRILLQGGIFAYPSDSKNLNGKLRLLYECAPLAFVMHMAGGSSTAGDSKTKSILDLIPSSLHQTTPVFLGSKRNIKNYFKG